MAGITKVPVARPQPYTLGAQLTIRQELTADGPESVTITYKLFDNDLCFRGESGCKVATRTENLGDGPNGLTHMMRVGRCTDVDGCSGGTDSPDAWFWIREYLGADPNPTWIRVVMK